MKRSIVSCCVLTLMLITSLGCGGGEKKDESGPRITGGSKVDPNVGPVKPSVAGEMKPPKQ